MIGAIGNQCADRPRTGFDSRTIFEFAAADFAYVPGNRRKSSRGDKGVNEQQDPFLRLLESYKAAVLAKDVEAFLAIYDDDLHVFDMWGKWSLRGLDLWRGLIDEWFSSLGDEHVVVSFDEAASTQIGGLVVGHAILKYTALSAEGREIRSLDNRMTVAARETHESWKIFHEHTSAPIDPASAKAILQR
jgi:ketosteroid isomerase-like protein